MKKCASDTASVGLTAAAVGKSMPETATKQTNTSTATSATDFMGFSFGGRSASASSPIFFSVNSRMAGTSTTFVAKAVADQVNSSVEPVTAPSEASTPTSTRDCSEYKKAAARPVRASTTIIEVMMRQAPSTLTNG